MSLHERAREVFLAAAERPASERARLLDALCGDDAELRREVESLLAYADDETSLPTTPVPVTSRARLAAGELFADRYRVVERLGSGGMGEVYRVHDTVLGVEVALKLLHTSDPASCDRLLNEVRLAREVSHPAVCRVFDVAQAGDELFFTMELVDGEDLAALLRRVGRMSPEKVVDIARQLCGGLAAAHARGVLHRDLKPSNVLPDREGRVRLSDFGIATTRAGASQAEAAGTPGYMAPEQRRPGGEVSERTDLFSLALVLYELLVGAPAFAETGMLTSPGSHVAPPARRAVATGGGRAALARAGHPALARAGPRGPAGLRARVRSGAAGRRPRGDGAGGGDPAPAAARSGRPAGRSAAVAAVGAPCAGAGGHPGDGGPGGRRGLLPAGDPAPGAGVAGRAGARGGAGVGPRAPGKRLRVGLRGGPIRPGRTPPVCCSGTGSRGRRRFPSRSSAWSPARACTLARRSCRAARSCCWTAKSGSCSSAGARSSARKSRPAGPSTGQRWCASRASTRPR